MLGPVDVTLYPADMPAYLRRGDEPGWPRWAHVITRVLIRGRQEVRVRGGSDSESRDLKYVFEGGGRGHEPRNMEKLRSREAYSPQSLQKEPPVIAQRD